MVLGNAIPISFNSHINLTGRLPVYRSSYVGQDEISYPPETSDGLLTISFNKSLNPAVVPATTAFAVDDGAANAVTNVAISGNKVTLTLTNDVEYGDVVTVAYTQPGANNLVDLSGNDVAAWTATAVTNNVYLYLQDQDGNLITDQDGHPIATI